MLSPSLVALFLELIGLASTSTISSLSPAPGRVVSLTGRVTDLASVVRLGFSCFLTRDGREEVGQF